MGERLTVEIEELVLVGVPHREARYAAAALEGELTRLFTERGVPAGLLRSGETAELTLSAWAPRPGEGLAELTLRLARALYEELEA